MLADMTTAPEAPRQPHDVSVHGDPRIDDWHWLRERDDPAVLAHLRAENAHTEAWFAPLQPLTAALYDEMLARIQEDDEDPPWRKNGWWYSSRTAKGQAYEIHLRRRGTPEGPEQVLLDLNLLAEGKPFLELGDFTVSPDTARLAYSLDETGALDYTLRVRDLGSGQDLPFVVERTGRRTAARSSGSRRMTRGARTACGASASTTAARRCWCTRSPTSCSRSACTRRATSVTSCSSPPAGTPPSCA
jgi:protease II